MSAGPLASVYEEPDLSINTSLNRVALAMAAALTVGVASAPANELIVNDFDVVGFGGTWGGFAQAHDPGTGSVRLFDETNGWGAGYTNFDQPIDLTGWSDHHIAVDFRTNADHGGNLFTVELLDTAGRGIKFDTRVLPGQSGNTTSIASRPLGNPSYGYNDWENFDFANVERMQLLGQWNGAEPFDVTFDSVRLQDYAYVGQDPNAAWRIEADRRIQKHRMANLLVNVTFSDGRPAPLASVRVEQRNHEFRFGTAAKAWLIEGPNANETYKQVLKDNFNRVVIENDLKWPAWSGEWGPNFAQDQTLSAL
ncbi:MAG: hypothetical protein AAGD32_14790, partial [Planctomycetota bacterium]